MLQLSRTLIKLDCETHDLVPPEQAHIVELGMEILYADGRPPKVWKQLFRPPSPISAGATAKHGITNEEVFDCPPFSEAARNLAHGMQDCDFIGYNIRFDLSALQANFKACGLSWTYEHAFLIDGYRLWQIGEPRRLEDGCRRFLGREPSGAHRALSDAQDAYDVCLAQIEEFKLPTTPQALHELCFPKDPSWIDKTGRFVWRNGVPVVTFGKHAGRSMMAVDLDYYEWILKKDFPEDVRRLAQDALHGVFPVPPQKPSEGAS